MSSLWTKVPLKKKTEKGSPDNGKRPSRSGYARLLKNKKDSSQYDSIERADKDSDLLKNDRQRMLYGYCAAFVGVLFISSGLALRQAVGPSISQFQINGFRCSSQFIIAVAFLPCVKGCSLRVPRELCGWLLLGCLFMWFTGYARYSAAYYLPLGVASAVSRSLTLIFNCVIACVVKKTIYWYHLVATVLAITGVFMVAQPLELYDKSFMSLDDADPEPLCRPNVFHVFPIKGNISGISAKSLRLQQTFIKERNDLFGYSLCVLDAVVSALHIQLVNHKLQQVNTVLYNMYTGIVGALVSFFIMWLLSEEQTYPPRGLCVLFVCLHVVSAGSYGLFQYTSYQLIPPVVVSLIMTLQIPTTFALQYSFLAQINPGHANPIEIAGAVVVFLSIALLPVLYVIRTRQQGTSTDTETESYNDG